MSGLYDARMSVLTKKMGLHIYASASDKQATMDCYMGNGLYTHALLKGPNNNARQTKIKTGRSPLWVWENIQKKRPQRYPKKSATVRHRLSSTLERIVPFIKYSDVLILNFTRAQRGENKNLGRRDL